MSSLKTHEFWDVVHGEELEMEDEDCVKNLRVRKIVVPRQDPQRCQLYMVRTDNTGSISAAESYVYHGRIDNIVPKEACMDFSVRTQIGDQVHKLMLTSVKGKGDTCTIC